MAAITHNRARQSSVIAVVVALHIVVCWMVMEATRPLKMRTVFSGLHLTYITRDPPKSVAIRVAPARLLKTPAPHGAANLPSSQPPFAVEPSQAAPAQDNNAIHPPIDWANELNRTANDVASGASTPQTRVFGAPHVAPTPPTRQPEFGWSRSRTHRLETGPGGVAAHLGYHCVIAIAALPFSVCTLGDQGANADLFKHMRDPSQFGDWKDPQ